MRSLIQRSLAGDPFHRATKGTGEWRGPRPLPDSYSVPRAYRMPGEAAKGIGEEYHDRKAAL
jgi:hypothetical protein